LIFDAKLRFALLASLRSATNLHGNAQKDEPNAEHKIKEKTLMVDTATVSVCRQKRYPAFFYAGFRDAKSAKLITVGEKVA